METHDAIKQLRDDHQKLLNRLYTMECVLHATFNNLLFFDVQTGHVVSPKEMITNKSLHVVDYLMLSEKDIWDKLDKEYAAGHDTVRQKHEYGKSCLSVAAADQKKWQLIGEEK